MLFIPSSTEPDYTFTVTIEQLSYDFRHQWNVREEAWYLYIGLAGRSPAIKLKVVTGTNLIEPFTYLDGVPNGVLILSDLVATYGRVGRNNYAPDGRFILVYMTSEEYNEIQTGVLA